MFCLGFLLGVAVSSSVFISIHKHKKCHDIVDKLLSKFNTKKS